MGHAAAQSNYQMMKFWTNKFKMMKSELPFKRLPLLAKGGLKICNVCEHVSGGPTPLAPDGTAREKWRRAGCDG